jgi:hypothetical protein
VFTAKKSVAFDPEIDTYLRRSGLAKPMKRLIDTKHHENVICVHWSGSQPVRVEGELDPEFVAMTVTAEAHHRGGEAMVARALTAVLTWGRKSARKQIRFDEIVKPELRRGDGSVLEPKLYRL